MSSPSPGNHWFSDSFQSANGPLSIYWQQPSGSWLVQGDAAVPQTSGVNIAVCPLYQSRVTVAVDVVIPTEPSGEIFTGPIVRLQNNQAYIFSLLVDTTVLLAQVSSVTGSVVTPLDGSAGILLDIAATFPTTVHLSLTVNSEGISGFVTHNGITTQQKQILNTLLSGCGGVGIWDYTGQSTFKNFTAEALLWYGGCCCTCE